MLLRSHLTKASACSVVVALAALSTALNASAVHADTPEMFAWVHSAPNGYTDGTVSKIDLATDKVVARFTVGKGDTNTNQDVAVSIPANVGVVANANDNTLSVFNPSTNAVTATISLPRAPGSVVLSPDGHTAYVAAGDNVYVVNTAAPALSGTLVLNSSFDALSIAVSPDGSTVYVSGAYGQLAEVKPAAGTASYVTVGASDYPHDDLAALSADGTKAYVINTPTGGHAALHVLDTATNTVGPALSTTESGTENGLAVTPDGANAVEAAPNSASVRVVSLSTGASTTVADSSGPNQVAISPDSSTAYITHAKDTRGVVSKLDIATGTVTDAVNVGGDVMGIAIGSVSTAPPVAADHSYTTNTGTNLTVDAANGAKSGATFSNDPACWQPVHLGGEKTSHGDIYFNPDGSFTYTPDFGFYGDDQIPYSLYNSGNPGGSWSNTATITIHVQAPDTRT